MNQKLEAEIKTCKCFYTMQYRPHAAFIFDHCNYNYAVFMQPDCMNLAQTLGDAEQNKYYTYYLSACNFMWSYRKQIFGQIQSYNKANVYIHCLYGIAISLAEDE
jgi:hypothetical protein